MNRLSKKCLTRGLNRAIVFLFALGLAWQSRHAVNPQRSVDVKERVHAAPVSSV
jgi:hypothetical protein